MLKGTHSFHFATPLDQLPAMRVCLIVNQIAAWGKLGGYGMSTRRIGAELAKAGVDVHVVVPRRKGQGHVERLDGMTVHGQSLAEVLFGRKLYREIDADVYHACEPTICGFWAQAACPDRVHLVTSIDPRDSADWRTEFRNATWERRFKHPLQRLYEDGPLVRRSVANAAEVFIETELLQDKAQSVYQLPSLPRVLPKPIPIPDGPFEKASRPLCVFLGRMDPRKRPELFFELAARMSDVEFVAIGKAHDARYQCWLERRYYHLPNVRAWGAVDPFASSTLFDVLRRAWVLVHPAAREGLPSAYQEASTHEMAILAEADPGQYVTRFGRVVAPGSSVETWEAELRGLLETEAWRERGRAGREYNINRHAPAVALEAHLAAYREHLDRGDCSHKSRSIATQRAESPAC